MPKTGRPALAAEEHRRRGNPSRKPLPKLSEVTRLDRIDPTPPDYLAAAGVALYSHLAQLSWVAASDAPTVVEVCQLADLRQRVLMELQADGSTSETGHGRQRHPHWTTFNELSKMIHSLLAVLGLNPSERSRLALGEVRESSKLETLRASAEAKRTKGISHATNPQ